MASRGTEYPLTLREAPTLGAAYDGTHTVSAMGSEVVYTYYYEFSEGNYVFNSSFEMGGEPYEYEETGTYSVTDTSISFTPTEGDPYTGTITDETTISVPIKASSMASRGTEYPLTLREGE
jgi:2',3'-cyclic-nucleotide 2'-phosphodiesterase (5'-nucleotidase family)